MSDSFKSILASATPGNDFQALSQQDLVAFELPLKQALSSKKEQAAALTLVEKLQQQTPAPVFAQLLQGLTIDLCALTADAKHAKVVLPLFTKTLTADAVPTVLLAGFLVPLVSVVDAPPQGKWKAKVAALQILVDCDLLPKLASTKQIQPAMARLVQTLVACSKEVRAEIVGASKKLLAQVGNCLVKCSEIRGAVAEELIGCLKNPALARECLTKIVNTTFLSQIDAASFALLFPIVLRALKEKQFETKKYGLMICGSAVILLNDAITVLKSPTGGEGSLSYLDTLLPLLKELALDPGFEIQREAAKALAAIGQEMPEVLEHELLPWALEKMMTDDGACVNGGSETASSDRAAAAHALAEMLQSSPDAKLLDRLLADVVRGRALGSDSAAAKKCGAFSLLGFLAKKVDGFERRCLKTEKPEDSPFSWALAGLRDSSCQDDSFNAASSMIYEYGQRGCDDLLPALADALVSFEPEYRPLVMTLLRQLIVRSAEGRTYGTDMMSDVNTTPTTRTLFAILLQITRVDSEAELRRQSGKVLEEQVQSVSKVKKETRAKLMQVLSELKACGGECGFMQRRKTVAEWVISENSKDDSEFSNEVGAAGMAMAVGAGKTMTQLDWLAVVADSKKVADEHRLTVKGVKHADGSVDSVDEDVLSFGWTELESKTKTALNNKFFPQEAIISAVLENALLDNAMTAVKNSVPAFLTAEADLAALRALLESEVYSHYTPSANDLDQKLSDDVLCHVNNLMLMYGGGHLLLKDTTLELCKFKRYGVVGRNGTGKTTLMNLIAKRGVPGIPDGMTSIHVKPEVLDNCMDWTCKDFLKSEVENAKKDNILAKEFAEDAEKALADPASAEKFFDVVLEKVLFPQELRSSTIGELSGGWRMRLLIAGSMLKRADVLLLDEPTNHLDFLAVNWLCDYLATIESAVMVISHDPFFLNRVCTDVINYNKGKLVYYEGNFDAFTKRMGMSAADAEALLAGQVGVSEEGGVERAAGSGNGPAARVCADDDGADGAGKDAAPSPTSSIGANSTVADSDGDMSPTSSVEGSVASSTESTPKAGGSGMGSSSDRKAKIVFPIPGKVKGLTSLAKPVLEINNLTYAYTEEKGDVIKGVSAKITMNSRIHIRGVNGAGKTTLLNMICGEVHPNASACAQKGTVARHRNCRLAYMAQQHMHHMADFMETSPYIYIQKRYVHGYDQALQERLLSCKDDKELEDRKARAKAHGKYGNMLKNLVGRQLRGKEFYYEACWENLPDTKQNTWINMEDLRKLGCECFALAYDERAAIGDDLRPLTQREIVKHLESFGITEELALNRNIGMFSAGQKSKVSLAAAFWIRPHLVALDEPTNYIDLETLEALTLALQRFKGGVICISHCENFVKQVCGETWTMENGGLTITKVEKEKKK